MIVFDPSGVPGGDGPPTTSIVVSTSKPRASVAVLGAIDLAGTQRVADAIAFASAGDGVTDVDVDASGVSGADVAGLRRVLQAGVTLSARGQRFVLSLADDGPLGRLLALTQLELDGFS